MGLSFCTGVHDEFSWYVLGNRSSSENGLAACGVLKSLWARPLKRESAGDVHSQQEYACPSSQALRMSVSLYLTTFIRTVMLHAQAAMKGER